MLGISLLVALAIPLVTVFLALNRVFKPQEKRKHLVVILLSYLSLILCFGGSYYTMSAFSDRIDAREKHTYYESKANYRDSFGKIVVRKDSRAFSGINSRLWSGVDWPDYKGNQLRNTYRSPVSARDMIQAAKQPLDNISNFQYDARFNVFSSTLYFSVVNMTTLGFGDITPTTWFTRLTSNIQVLTGLILFYFGLSMVIGNWWTNMTDASQKTKD
ncbi:MAG TPA: two pore domain potassium channel family protein [Actinobacteria bacterium]|nr:two pore domain potassium channel family protein [Actinomycetota bacterium]